MASIERRGARYRIVYRFGGRRLSHALQTSDAAAAEAARTRLEDGLRLVRLGHLDPPPPGADVAVYLMTGGRAGRPAPPRPPAADAGGEATPLLGDLIGRYLAAHGPALEASTLETARIHLRHFVRTFGERAELGALGLADLQRHVDRRREAPGRLGARLSPVTLRKEMNTLSSLWSWARPRGWAAGPFPSAGLIYPRQAERPAFMTWAEIGRRLEAGADAARRRALWSCLYLSTTEVDASLDHLKSAGTAGWVYAMALFCAHTGARRSEAMRARAEDFDRAAGQVTIRERKRVKGVVSTRRVPLSGRCCAELFPYFEAHGRELAFVRRGGRPLTRRAVVIHLRRSVAGSEWDGVRGWHVLRHSFASNCAAAGVDQRMIDAWLGHETPEMARRYRHLFPDQARNVLRSVYA